jgi:triosephosphate isomerase (TIM)
MSRDRIFIANWKMYKTAREATDYIEHLAAKISGCKCRVLLAVPFTSIAQAAACARQFGVLIGAQNMNDARDGAFTGEIAALMLKEAGANFVLLGHSERRRLFGETDELIHRKVLRAFQDDLQPVLCVGETLSEREEGKTDEVLKRQIETALADVPKDSIKHLIIAYEPVWAIGTRQVPTPEYVQEVHAHCRKCLEEMFGKRIANQVHIVYGGSVSPDNVNELVSLKDVDGVLVGGASLDPDRLSAIVQNCEGIR